ncbi:MAG: hypothetical protein AB1489_12730 [Acidobacteriota bacterium]
MTNEANNEIDISELLQIVLMMQGELGVVSDILLDTLKTGDIDKQELIRALHNIGQLSIDSLSMISGEDVSLSENEIIEHDSNIPPHNVH